MAKIGQNDTHTKNYGSLKETIESVSMLIPPLDPPPSTVRALGNFLFLKCFLNYLGCLVCCKKDFVNFLDKLVKNKAKEGRPKFDKLKVRGSI